MSISTSLLGEHLVFPEVHPQRAFDFLAAPEHGGSAQAQARGDRLRRLVRDQRHLMPRCKQGEAELQPGLPRADDRDLPAHLAPPRLAERSGGAFHQRAVPVAGARMLVRQPRGRRPNSFSRSVPSA